MIIALLGALLDIVYRPWESLAACLARALEACGTAGSVQETTLGIEQRLKIAR
jgi:hypothetical protein